MPDTYITSSHPWINFQLNLNKLTYKTWLSLGECASKCEHISNTPLRPNVSRELHQVYLAKGVRATTAIEGNTLTEEEVRRRLENTLHLPPSKEYLVQEIDNIIKACNLISSQIQQGMDTPIDSGLLCEYNALVLEKLPLEDHVIPGRFRESVVGVGTYRAPSPAAVPSLVQKMCEWLNGPDFYMPQLDPIVFSIIKAIIGHLYVAWIHPFGDGNGRTARLLEYDLLLRSGFPLPAAHLLSDHYNATRTEYYRQLDIASKMNDATGFIAYAVEGFRDGLREQLAVITRQVRDIVWGNYVHEEFKAIHTKAGERQRHVVLDISLQKNPVAKSDIPVLTPRLRKHYATKTDRTLSRDLSKLMEMKLLIQTKEGAYYPNRTLVEAFLPFRRVRKEAILPLKLEES